jgi:peptide/nickel transport system ATP-binding protein
MSAESAMTSAPPAGEPLLQVDALVKNFPVRSGAAGGTQRLVHAVSGVGLTVAEGETLGLVGESGCGKSTLGRMLVALDRPTSGTVLFDGHDITSLSRRRLRQVRRDMQLMFQDPYASLSARMKIGPIVSEPLRIQRVGTRETRLSRVEELLAEVGLPEGVINRYPHELSGGQRQRVGLARALALNPRLIVADEPVSALDVSVRAQILNLMKRVQQANRLTYVVISHDLSVIRYMASRVGVMYLGKLVEMGPSAAVLDHPAHPYTRGLLDSVPVPDPAGGRKRVVRVPAGEIPSAVNPPSGCRFRTRCPLAQQVCADVDPPLRPFATGQLAACHFPLEQPAGEAAGS